MLEHYVEERKKYVEEAKKSFEHQYGNYGYGEKSVSVQKEKIFSSALKIKFMIALMLFLSFLYCDYTETKIGQYTTQEIEQMISKNDFYQKLENYVMIEMSQN